MFDNKEVSIIIGYCWYLFLCVNNILHIYIWNPNDLYFWRSTPENKAFWNQKKGHLGST